MPQLAVELDVVWSLPHDLTSLPYLAISRANSARSRASWHRRSTWTLLSHMRQRLSSARDTNQAEAPKDRRRRSPSPPDVDVRDRRKSRSRDGVVGRDLQGYHRPPHRGQRCRPRPSGGGIPRDPPCRVNAASAGGAETLLMLDRPRHGVRTGTSLGTSRTSTAIPPFQ
jgi:hypothetical protein